MRLWRSKRARIAVAVLLLGGAAFWWMLPRPLFREPLSAVLLARDDTLLGARIASDGQWRFPESARVPERFAQALIAYEDRRFYRHPGVDPMAMVRALRSNWRARRVVSGASTLTMQLARLVQQQGGTRRGRSYFAKGMQALLALRLECSYSKRQLLALYASHAPFGGNVVGLGRRRLALLRPRSRRTLLGRSGHARGAAQCAGTDFTGPIAPGAAGAARPAAATAGRAGRDAAA